MGQMVQKFSQHQLKTTFANLKDDLCLAGPTPGTPPHRAPLSTAVHHSLAENEAGGLDPSSLLRNNPAVFHPKLAQTAGDVRYLVVLPQSKFDVITENPCSTKLPAFKVGRRLGCIQSASE